MLGAPYSITGPVIRNRGIGRTLDYPTANIAGWEDRAVPMAGVYATRAVLDGEKYPAVTNIGRNPTVNGEHTTIETHMLGFDADIYGQTLKVEFVELHTRRNTLSGRAYACHANEGGRRKSPRYIKK